MSKNKGLINIPLTIALSVGVLMVGGVTAFWQTAKEERNFLVVIIS